jgi:hypothetical protein
MDFQAINPKNQKLVNRVAAQLAKYNALNDQRDAADNNGEERLFNKLDRQCEKAFDKYLELSELLPARELKRIEKVLY